jgi:ubiquinone biosynthesis UbiH/UbiF/VisC/COQ6 family hydroxylase
MANANRILIVGAGPAGLAMARALSGYGLDIHMFERASRESLASPADDGREIALTHRSERLLRELGHWERLKAEEIGQLREALVLDGDAQDGLRFQSPGGKSEAGPLGWLVSNAALRRVAFDAVKDESDVTLHTDAVVTDVDTEANGVTLTLADGRRFDGDLLLAADTRFSFTRRACGIAADHHDFGKVMLVGRVRHDKPHYGTAWEWFRYGQTLALLPLHEAHTASVVITVAPAEARALQALPQESLGDVLAQRFDQRLGAMTALGPLHAYPLVGVYPKRLVSERVALVGDAAVGMHPVTAHGYNFGLLGVATLSEALKAAQRQGRPLHDPRLLADYERRHRRATRPLYVATRLVAGLYTDDRLPARALRRAAVVVAGRLPGFATAIVKGLRDEGRGASPRWPITRRLVGSLLSNLNRG